MAKRQNFQFGSTTSNIQTMTVAELNNGWEQLSILYSAVLNGTFAAISEFSYDASQEIANAILALTGSQPTGTSMTELGDALIAMREEIETSSLTFKGYIATSAPSSSTYALVVGNLWINSATLPTTFPVAAADIQRWDGTAWVSYGSDYTPADFDFFRNINDNEGYYWFGGQWTVMSTDMSTTYFTLNQTSGKWEIKDSVNLPGAPTTTTPTAGDSSTQIATTKFVADSFAPLASPALTGIPTAPTPASGDSSTQIATTAWVQNNTSALPAGAIVPFAGTNIPTGFLLCDGAAVSRTDYADLFDSVGTTYGAGDGSTTFNLPNYSNAKMITGNNIPVKGNGITLGLTNGSSGYGIRPGSSGATLQSSAYGKNVPGSNTTSNQPSASANIGVTTDPNLSGIIADTSNMQRVNYIIKY